MNNNNNKHSTDTIGMLSLSLRMIIGWTYFSAFWRRLIIDNKLIPEEAGYIGEKFNHFLPNALGIKPIIEYLVLNPDTLQVAMVALDRKSTRLNSSHVATSYAVFCLKKKS